MSGAWERVEAGGTVLRVGDQVAVAMGTGWGVGETCAPSGLQATNPDRGARARAGSL